MTLRERVGIGGRPSSRHDELRPAECMTCGRGVRLNPADPLALQPRCRCTRDRERRPATVNWRVELGPGEPPQLICTGGYPQPFAQRDRLRVAQPGRGAVVHQAIDILRRGFARGEG